jgi:hypothetical protein
LANCHKYLDVLKRMSPSTAPKEFHDFLNELEEAGACQREGGETDWLEGLGKSAEEESKARAYNIQRAQDAREKIRYRARASELGASVKIWSGPSADECSALERDFTTAGTPGRLGCPFAGRARGGGSNGSARGHSVARSSVSRGSLGKRSSKRASFQDPISTDISAVARPKTAEGSVEGSHSVALCPIRFLDQHSPEEVALYFEKHKHELPRSHEICVKRFQENEEAVRGLDSKYANMVAMVTDLGMKHAPMLPDADELAIDGEDEPQPSAASKVERWAQDVEAGHPVEVGEDKEEEEDQEIELDEERASRFDRSLKDIRVGESPSRPWGIHVPDDYSKDDDAASKKSDPTASPLEPATAVDEMSNVEMPPDHPPVSGGGQCPFGALMASKGATKETPVVNVVPDNSPEPHTQVPQKPLHPTPGPKSPVFVSTMSPEHQGTRLVFNGPVFFGYTPEQTASLLQSLGTNQQDC